MAEANRTPTDKRALILRWIEERQRVLDDHNSRDGFCLHAQACCDVACGDDLGLALAALRAETERHEQMPEWRNEEDKALGFQLGCFCQGDGGRPSWPCETIDRLFCSLGLQDSGR